MLHLYQQRRIQTVIEETLARDKSILLLGARQTGKTTLLKHIPNVAHFYNFSIIKIRRQFEGNPDSLADEINALWHRHSLTKPPLIIIDEVQKVPEIIDVIQYLIDDNKAQFIITGSSARKLKRPDRGDVNLLPGRVVKLQLDPMTLSEINHNNTPIEELLSYGCLPDIVLNDNLDNKERDLQSYVDIYLEEEIRQEALVRNLGAFSSFLEIMASSIGHPINKTKLSQDVGVNVHLIQEYIQILVDCLIIDEIKPVSHSKTRQRLNKASKYLFYDLGVRRVCAKEGSHLSALMLGPIFEHYVGMELLHGLRITVPRAQLKYWRDHNGPEIDYCIEHEKCFTPVEVKWTSNPSLSDCRHIMKFMEEYPCRKMAYLVCQVPAARMLTPSVMAIPWHEIRLIVDSIST